MNFRTTRITFGWILTFLWIAFLLFLLYLNLDSAKSMKLNEWGDFFAGASAPLAFLWLVIGYFQQGEELGQNTQALKQQELALELQTKELKNSVEQQEKLASITQKELDHNLAKTDKDKKIQKSLAQPLLTASVSNTTRHGDVTNISYSFINFGNSITRVEISSNDLPQQYKLNSKFHDFWERDAKRVISFSFASTTRKFPLCNFSLTLTFMDALLEESTYILNFETKTNGSIQFIKNNNKDS